MELTSRQLEILQAIVNDYIKTAEPVGSRTISKKYDLGISSATIRNEMSDLEELGFLMQPHTSAGRVPSEKAYRLYVDRLMTYEDFEEYKNKIAEQILQIKCEANKKSENANYVIKEIGKIISTYTGYPTVVSTPKTEDIVLKHLELVPVDSKTIVMMVVTDANKVKTYTLVSNKEVYPETIREISAMLNENLKGLMISDINYPLIQTLKKLMGDYKGMLEVVLELISKLLETSDDTEVFVNGADKIFEMPEYKDVLKAKTLIHILDQKEKIQNLLNKNKDPGIKIIIGKENKIEEIEDLSVVAINYTANGRLLGTVGIIGPVRMDYSRIISLLSYISQNMGGMMQRLLEVKKDE